MSDRVTFKSPSPVHTDQIARLAAVHSRSYYGFEKRVPATGSVALSRCPTRETVTLLRRNEKTESGASGDAVGERSSASPEAPTHLASEGVTSTGGWAGALPESATSSGSASKDEKAASGGSRSNSREMRRGNQ